MYLEGDAGPYHLYVTVRVPQVIPGIAEIQVRSASSDVQQDRDCADEAERAGVELAADAGRGGTVETGCAIF